MWRILGDKYETHKILRYRSEWQKMLFSFLNGAACRTGDLLCTNLSFRGGMKWRRRIQKNLLVCPGSFAMLKMTKNMIKKPLPHFVFPSPNRRGLWWGFTTPLSSTRSALEVYTIQDMGCMYQLWNILCLWKILHVFCTCIYIIVYQISV